jgi:uncharacterized cupin superfamily protein
MNISGAAMSKPSIIPLDRSARMETWPDYPEAEIAAGDRGSRGHFWFKDNALGISAGIWESEANLGRWMPWPVDEFVLVLEGEVVVVEADRETVFGPGDSFVIPRGCRCIWNQCTYFKKFMMMFNDPRADAVTGVPKVVRIDATAKLALSELPQASMLLTPVPTQHDHLVYQDPTGQLNVGVWDTTGYHRKLIDFPRHELMHLLEGSVTFEDDQGRPQTFNAGDTFFVPLGTPNSWKSEGYLRKIFVIFQPKN